MAFIVRDLSVLAYANGFTLWHYKTGSQPIADAAAEDFFTDAGDMMAAGDMILVSGAGGGRVLCVARADTSSVVTGALG